MTIIVITNNKKGYTMHSMSFHIYKTPNHNTWTLSYKTGTLRYKAVFPTQDDAMQASYDRAAAATD